MQTMTKMWATVFFLLCSSAGIKAAETQNIIDQTYGVGAGAFDLGVFVPGLDGETMHLAPGSTAMTGWTVGGPGDGIKWYGPNSIASVDLTFTLPSSISTVIPTVAGAFYILSFDILPAHSGINDRMNVFFGNTGGVFFADDVSVKHEAVEVRAGGPETIITFSANDLSTARQGPGIDNVAVTFESVPEPCTPALAALGTLVAIASFWKRHRRGASPT